MEELQTKPSLTVHMGGLTSARVVAAINGSERAMNKLLGTCLSHHGLNVTKWIFLNCLTDGPKTPTQIAKIMDVKTPYIAIIIRQFRAEQAAIFAEVGNEDDTRSKVISLTTHGHAYIAEIEAMLQECIQRELAQKVAPADLAVFLNVSEFIAKNVKHREV